MDKESLMALVKTVVDKFQLVPEFRKVRGLVKQHLDYLNYFFQTDIKRIVFANVRIQATRYPYIYIRFLDFRIGKPPITMDGSVEDTSPQTCRLSDQMYAAPIMVNIGYTQGSPDNLVREINRNIIIEKMAIMWRSCCCVLYNRDEAERNRW
ncbi:unnamed protein product [Vicia faba]|uniref:DNA-directed RNA polymerase n=1 Tax=Vicia faba TaxID=3906 RepID=A0AAV0YWZ4_VICFA|nr:unnamed protein product [Vicia faba]